MSKSELNMTFWSRKTNYFYFKYSSRVFVYHFYIYSGAQTLSTEVWQFMIYEFMNQRWTVCWKQTEA